ncbi:helicase-associated domain-containing protein [Pseudonocardia sp.]|uniref:helicase-associated domain-containing protein n=1 Tax=Pseudonocardia sp. TaxID=60912 RepID=UPI00260A4DBF|nr:helicase-associated domain-containing protein [Pseudonocardia sp.]
MLPDVPDGIRVASRPGDRDGGIGAVTFADHLARLDVAALAALLEQRRDVLVEPVPRSLDQLALRLGGADSLSRALPSMDRDETVVARAVALLEPPDRAALARWVQASEELAGEAVDRLCARGLAWREGGRVELPLRLAAHFAGELGDFRSVRRIAGQARVEQVRDAVAALGGGPAGGTKPALVQELERLVTDPAVVVAATERLSPAADRHLRLLLDARGFSLPGRVGPTAVELVDAGLLVAVGHLPELPREIAAMLLVDGAVTGRPAVDAATGPVDDGRAGAEAALLALVTLLDDARTRPIAALKKGGVGARERARLAKSLKVEEPALWIDVAHAAGLLAAGPGGYAPTAAYDRWRDEEPVARWAGVVQAWHALDLAPTSREIDDGEVAPPLPMHSGAGILRRSLLRAAAGGGSLRSAAEHLGWFCPLHVDVRYAGREAVAAVREATALGVVTGDRLTALGELLVATAGTDAAELARRAAGLLPESRGLLVLQSDLTAVVSGQPTAAAARLLAACAVAESRGAAAIWRFTPASVRSAMDAGWSADELRTDLAAVTGQELPQPLDYLISDVARRHGSVRVRGVRCCVTGSESEIAELRHTRALRPLRLAQLAPTVLTSPNEPDDVVAKLRAAGFSPMPEDADGAVVLAPRAAGPAPEPAPRAPRRRIAPADLAARLLSGDPPEQALSATHHELARVATHLDDGELALLADAVDHGRDVRIRYRNAAGNHSTRDIRPHHVYDRWLSAWCHLRDDEREFRLGGIEFVAPVG